MIGVGGRSFAFFQARIVRVAVRPSMAGICHQDKIVGAGLEHRAGDEPVSATPI
ncbi:MAG: hypothetical protein JWM91_680 [Rhodospirillales bacterium]|nr:hypothetical protein [Rhodospirillales bacterium]